MTGTSSNDLRRIALEGSEGDQLQILNQELPRDVLELLVDADRPTIAIALVSAQFDMPRDLVRRLEDAERERVRAGTSLGLDELIGNMENSSTEFRLKMRLEDIRFERLRQVFEDLDLPEHQRGLILDRKRSGSPNETVAEAVAATSR